MLQRNQSGKWQGDYQQEFPCTHLIQYRSTYHVLNFTSRGVSFVALMMDKKDNLFAVNGRGRPSKERTEEIRLHGELKKDLASL